MKTGKADLVTFVDVHFIEVGLPNGRLPVTFSRIRPGVTEIKGAEPIATYVVVE